jgi:hypothetical protein
VNLLLRLLRFLLRPLPWREHHRQSHRKDDFRVELELLSPLLVNGKPVFYYTWSYPMSLSIDLNTDTGGHVAVLTATNLDGSPAQNVAVTYASSDASVATVDAASGAIVIVGVGTCTITGTGTRGKFTHEAGDSIAVTQDANTGDFNVALALS